MSEEIDNGGSAFPAEIDTEHYAHAAKRHEAGMTLRDWFAGQAIAPLISAAIKNGGPDKTKIASDAYDIADEAIAARKRKQ